MNCITWLEFYCHKYFTHISKLHDILIVKTMLLYLWQHHVVYMGSSLSNGNRRDAEAADQSAYLEMLSSIIPRLTSPSSVHHDLN